MSDLGRTYLVGACSLTQWWRAVQQWKPLAKIFPLGNAPTQGVWIAVQLSLSFITLAFSIASIVRDGPNVFDTVQVVIAAVFALVAAIDAIVWTSCRCYAACNSFKPFEGSGHATLVMVQVRQKHMLRMVYLWNIQLVPRQVVNLYLVLKMDMILQCV